MTLVSGRSVVSARQVRPFNWPTRTAERRLLIGKSGFVISEGLENDGTARSMRRLSGASRRRVRSFSVLEPGWRMVPDGDGWM